MKKVILYGAGAYADVFFHEAERYGIVDIVAFTVDEEYISTGKKYGLPVVPFERVEALYPPSHYAMLVLCGYSVMRKRKIMYDRAKKKGYELLNYLSPGAVLEDGIQMGENNIIMSNSVVGFGGIMGSNNIIRQNVYLGHEFNMGNHIIISPGCSLGGCSHIHDFVFFCKHFIIDKKLFCLRIR